VFKPPFELCFTQIFSPILTDNGSVGASSAPSHIKAPAPATLAAFFLVTILSQSLRPPRHFSPVFDSSGHSSVLPFSSFSYSFCFVSDVYVPLFGSSRTPGVFSRDFCFSAPKSPVGVLPAFTFLPSSPTAVLFSSPFDTGEHFPHFFFDPTSCTPGPTDNSTWGIGFPPCPPFPLCSFEGRFRIIAYPLDSTLSMSTLFP